MLAHALKKMVDEMKGCPNKERTDEVDRLWLQAQELLTEAREEIKNALPHLRKRGRNPDGTSSNPPDPAYTAIVKVKGLLEELNEST